MHVRKLLLVLVTFNLLLFSTFQYNLKTVDASGYSKVATKVATKAAKEIITDSAVNMAIEIVANYEMEQSLKENFKTKSGYIPVCLDKTDKCSNPMQVKKVLTTDDKRQLSNEVETILNKKAGMDGFKKFLDFFVPIFLIGLATNWITTILDSETESFFNGIAKEALINTNIISGINTLVPRADNMSLIIQNPTGNATMNEVDYYIGSNTGRVIFNRFTQTMGEYLIREYEFNDMEGVVSFSNDLKVAGLFGMDYFGVGFGSSLSKNGMQALYEGIGFELLVGPGEIVLYPHGKDSSEYIYGEVVKNDSTPVQMKQDLMTKYYYLQNFFSDKTAKNAIGYSTWRDDSLLAPNVRYIYVKPKKFINNEAVTEVLIYMYSGDVYTVTARTRPSTLGPTIYNKAFIKLMHSTSGFVDIIMQIQQHNNINDAIKAPTAPVKPSDIPQSALDSSIYKNDDGTFNILPPAAIPITLPSGDEYVQPKPTPSPTIDLVPEWQRIDTKEPVSIDEDLLTVKDPIRTPDGEFELVGTPDILPQPTPNGSEKPPTDENKEDFDESSCEKPRKIDFNPVTSSFTNAFPFSIPFDLKRIIDNTFGGIGSQKPAYELTFFGDDVVLTIPDMIDQWIPFMKSILVVLFDISIIYMFYRFMKGGD